MKTVQIVVLIVGLAGPPLAVYVSQDAQTRVLETARAAVASMESDGAIRARRCHPNETVVDTAMWRNLPSDRYRTIAARSLAIVCEPNGADRSMVIFAADGTRRLGRYDSEDDRYEAYD